MPTPSAFSSILPEGGSQYRLLPETNMMPMHISMKRVSAAAWSENASPAFRPDIRFGVSGERPWAGAASIKHDSIAPASGHRPAQSDAADRSLPLTARQLECLQWISKGKSSTDVGAILAISGRTVDYHVAEICQRLGVRTRMQAVAFALRSGWLRDRHP